LLNHRKFVTKHCPIGGWDQWRRISTYGGISMASSDHYENAQDPIRINREFGSSDMKQSEECRKKHHHPSGSTLPQL
jgi:hypothetical protein